MNSQDNGNNDEDEKQLEDMEKTLVLAKLDPENIIPLSQLISFTAEELHTNNYKLLQLDNNLLDAFRESGTVFIKGADNENAVICTETGTYDLLETETSNSLLVVESLKFKDAIEDPLKKATSNVKVHAIFYDYLELTPSKPHLQVLYQLLNKSLYKGPEYEDEINKNDVYTYAQLLNTVQASRKELDNALEAMHVVRMNDKIRVLDFEYHFRILSYMLRLLDENSWSLDEVDYEETLNTLTDLVPTEIISSLFDLYTEKSKIIDGLQLFKYKEVAVCKFFARVLLYSAGKFNFQEFLQAWKESVPEGMVPHVDMLNGIAIIDKTSIPNVIRAFEEEKLPENILERFEVLFHAKEKWTVPQIAPYIQRMTNEKTDVNAILAKYARASSLQGVKYYSAKHTK